MVKPPPLDLHALRARLTQRLMVLREDLHQSRMRSDEHLGHSPEVTDQKDCADRMNQSTMDNAELARDLVELSQVESALQRIDAGTLGICQTCGADIPMARLNAQPWSLRCVTCQAQHEAANG
jgi:DnaK suppressor protein